MFGGGDASLDLARSAYFSDDALNWVIKAYSNYGRVEAGGTALEQAASNLIHNNDFAGFAERCGTEVVLQESRVAAVVAIFSVRNLSRFERDRLSTMARGESNVGIFSAEAKASYSRLIQEA
jgi:hypothetical protein